MVKQRKNDNTKRPNSKGSKTHTAKTNNSHCLPVPFIPSRICR